MATQLWAPLQQREQKQFGTRSCFVEAIRGVKNPKLQDVSKRLSIEQCKAHPWVPCSEIDGAGLRLSWCFKGLRVFGALESCLAPVMFTGVWPRLGLPGSPHWLVDAV